MRQLLAFAACVVFATAGCDDKKEGAAVLANASASASALAAPSAVATTTAATSENSAASATATPSASSEATMVTGDAKDVVLTVKDPAKEPSTSIKAAPGGSVTVFLPDHPGTVWSVESSDKALGKAKEEVIPGFAPGTLGHQFKWTTSGPGFKTGQKLKTQFVNRKRGEKTGKPNESFELTIEIT